MTEAEKGIVSQELLKSSADRAHLLDTSNLYKQKTFDQDI